MAGSLSRAELLQRLSEFHIARRGRGQRNTTHRGLPCRPNAANTGGNSARMGHNPSAAGKDQVSGAKQPVGIYGLFRGLPGRKHRHDLIPRAQAAETSA